MTDSNISDEPKPASWGEWTIKRQRNDDCGLAVELHHPSGEVILASSFEPVEMVDGDDVDVMFYRENIGTFSDSDGENYDPVMIAVTGFTAVQDIAERNERDIGWIDGMWAEEGVHNSDMNQQDLLDEYFTS